MTLEASSSSASLLLSEGEKYVIVDYKTDVVTAEMADEKTAAEHAGQAEAYMRGIESMVNVDQTVFVYPRAGVEVAVAARAAR